MPACTAEHRQVRERVAGGSASGTIGAFPFFRTADAIGLKIVETESKRSVCRILLAPEVQNFTNPPGVIKMEKRPAESVCEYSYCSARSL